MTHPDLVPLHLHVLLTEDQIPSPVFMLAEWKTIVQLPFDLHLLRERSGGFLGNEIYSRDVLSWGHYQSP